MCASDMTLHVPVRLSARPIAKRKMCGWCIHVHDVHGDNRKRAHNDVITRESLRADKSAAPGQRDNVNNILLLVHESLIECIKRNVYISDGVRIVWCMCESGFIGECRMAASCFFGTRILTRRSMHTVYDKSSEEEDDVDAKINTPW